MKNPNALAGGVSTIAGGEALVEILNLFGVHVSTPLGIFAAGLIGAAVLAVGRDGLTGVWNRILHGTGPAPPSV